MPNPFGADLADVVFQLRRTTRRELRRHVVGDPLTGAEGELVAALVAEPGQSVAGVAERLCLAPNTVSTLVGRAARAGLVRRERDPGDRRTVRLFASDAAVARVGAWRARRGELVARAVAGLSPGDRRALHDALPALRRLAEQVESRSGRREREEALG
ncbi:MAG: MarR family winged helix-turn-helix transcriptional regulator [Acidimicrobiia bacterium]